MLIQLLVTDNAMRRPDALAFRWVDRQKTLTFSEAVAEMEAAAGYLYELSIRAGDRMTIFAHKGMDYLVSMFGIWRIGAIPSLVNVKFAEELDYYLGGFMRGYWNRREKTAEAIRGKFLHTGDAGTMDADGYVTMRGRFSELIEVAGRTWFPRDVEEAIAAQPGIREAALVGLPDTVLGARPVAFFTGSGVPAELKAAIAGAVPYDLAPLEIRAINAFPMTPTGKIAKADLRQAAITVEALANAS